MTPAAAPPWESAPTGVFAARAAALAALIPTLETARLRLRAPRIEDFGVYLAANGATARDREPLWLDFSQMTASWLQRGFGPWTIETRDGGDAVGFLPVDHDFGDPEPEIGWFVRPDRRRAGIATEAARAALDRLLPALGFRSIVSYVARDNAASLAVAARLGGIRQRDGAHPDPDVIVHRYPLNEARP